MQARAVVATEIGRVEYLSVDVPEPDEEELVIRLLHSWISNGTESSFIRGERIAGDTPRSDADPLPFPHVPGYQKVGHVERVGAKVPNLKAGDIVFATMSKVNGMFYPYGGHISPSVTHFSQVWKLPDGVSPESASGLVLSQVGFNAGIRPYLSTGDKAVVIGDGLVGHWAAQTLQHRGARVMMLGKHEDRLVRFETRLMDKTVNIAVQDPVKAVNLFAPEGVQAVVDTVGSIQALEMFLPLMKRNGQISSAGFYGRFGQIDIQKMRDRELTLHTPAGWSKERMDETLELLSQGILKTLHLITHRFPAVHAAEAYELILSKKEHVLGVLLDWEQ